MDHIRAPLLIPIRRLVPSFQVRTPILLLRWYRRLRPLQSQLNLYTTTNTSSNTSSSIHNINSNLSVLANASSQHVMAHGLTQIMV